MSQQFEVFYNNWTDLSEVLNPTETINSENILYLPLNLDEDFFINLKLDKESIQQYSIAAAKSCASSLGHDIALCFSGGLDSQITLLSFLKAGVKFTTYCLVFDNNLNRHDVKSAREFCNKNGITLKEINIDTYHFLNKENYNIGIKYKSVSPHFNLHYKMFDYLINLGHSGIVCGGQVPLCNNSVWGINFVRNPYNFINYNIITENKCQGSFLSYDPRLSWAIALNKQDLKISELLRSAGTDRNLSDKINYNAKINAYVKSGFNIIPQKQKYTGFEYIKKEYEKKMKDPYAFEKLFRYPLAQELKLFSNQVAFKIPQNIISQINKLITENSTDNKLRKLFGSISDSYIENSKFYNI